MCFSHICQQIVNSLLMYRYDIIIVSEDIITSNSSPTRDNLEQEDAICVSANWRRERCKDTPATVPDRSQESNVTLPSENVLNRKKVSNIKTYMLVNLCFLN